MPSGTLFQLPTLMGFALQGFSSDLVAVPRFPKNHPLLRFPAKPHGLAATLQRFSLTEPAALSALPLV
jgi:hypothetical protein